MSVFSFIYLFTALFIYMFGGKGRVEVGVCSIVFFFFQENLLSGLFCKKAYVL